jgi:hypothetical protein
LGFLCFLNNFYFQDIRWLSAGKATARLFDLSNEVVQLIWDRAEVAKSKKAEQVLDLIEGNDFWISVAYMSDVFSELNKSCLAMQGRNVTIFKVS